MYICDAMKRFNFFIEQNWIDRIRKDMHRLGFTTVSSFIRFVIIRHFADLDKDLDGSEK